jgi:DNA-binding NarL/FixJ family response regulator
VTTASLEAVNGTGVRVLVADDDELHREALRDLLEALGFEVVGEAANGSQAVAASADGSPHVVIMDLRMPVLGGIESTQMIRARDPSVQVIILTAYDDFGLRSAAEEAGAFCYLPKGTSPEVITHAVLAASKLRPT